jgi:hypothetical protein
MLTESALVCRDEPTEVIDWQHPAVAAKARALRYT